jgi:outer membrane protein assembly factor BamA
MKNGEVANGLKFDEGIKAVQKLYGRKGYLTLGLKPTAVFDDQAHKVEYRIALTEGPQFRMGNLIVKGLPDNQTNLLRGKWEMLKGDIFDAGYEEDFFRTTFRDVFRTISEERLTQGKLRPEVATTMRLNRAELTVDVTIEFSEKKEQ